MAIKTIRAAPSRTTDALAGRIGKHVKLAIDGTRRLLGRSNDSDAHHYARALLTLSEGLHMLLRPSAYRRDAKERARERAERDRRFKEQQHRRRVASSGP